jgi:hypothetical protein
MGVKSVFEDPERYTHKKDAQAMTHVNIQDYIGDLNGGSLMLSDSRLVSEILLHMKDETQWRQSIVDENVLQRKSPHSALRSARTVRVRLQSLGLKFIEEVVNADNRLYQQLLMLALLIHSPIVADFMREYVFETRRVYKTHLSKDMWYQFIEDKYRVHPEMLKYSQGTIDKMGKNIFRAFAEAEYIDSARNKKIQPVYLMPEWGPIVLPQAM